MTPAALGFRPHSGWAAVVAVAGPRTALSVIDRRRVELADPRIPGAKQPYHAAEPLDLKKAEGLIARCVEASRRLARDALGAAVRDLGQRGHEVVGCGLLLGSGRTAPTLAATLASHALIHTADGDHFRDALRHAADHCGLRLTAVREQEILARGAHALGIPAGALPDRLKEIGRTLGPPWRQDEKYAALAAWLALAAASDAKAR